jgi:hypothetical protein
MSCGAVSHSQLGMAETSPVQLFTAKCLPCGQLLHAGGANASIPLLKLCEVIYTETKCGWSTDGLYFRVATAFKPYGQSQGSRTAKERAANGNQVCHMIAFQIQIQERKGRVLVLSIKK